MLGTFPFYIISSFSALLLLCQEAFYVKKVFEFYYIIYIHSITNTQTNKLWLVFREILFFKYPFLKVMLLEEDNSRKYSQSKDIFCFVSLKFSLER